MKYRGSVRWLRVAALAVIAMGSALVLVEGFLPVARGLLAVGYGLAVVFLVLAGLRRRRARQPSRPDSQGIHPSAEPIARHPAC